MTFWDSQKNKRNNEARSKMEFWGSQKKEETMKHTRKWHFGTVKKNTGLNKFFNV